MLSGADERGVAADGELMKVAYAADEIEGEMIQGLLQNAGIPSLLRSVGLQGRRRRL